MRISDMTTAQLKDLSRRVDNGEIIFCKSGEGRFAGFVLQLANVAFTSKVCPFMVIKDGSYQGMIKEMDGKVVFDYLRFIEVFTSRSKYATTVDDIESLEILPDAKKAYTPPAPRKPKVVLDAPRIFDRLGQEVQVGEYMLLVHHGNLVFVQYVSNAGVNKLTFKNLETGHKFNRNPDGLNARNRDYTFQHSVKVTDKATLDLIMLNKLAA